MTDETYKSHVQKLVEEAYELGYLRGTEAVTDLLEVRRKQAMTHCQHSGVKLDPPLVEIFDRISSVVQRGLDPEPYLVEKVEIKK